jgi:predicted DNA-binding protein
MKTTAVKLPADLAERASRLKKTTGISESAILRQAIEAGLPMVEKAMLFLKSPPTPPHAA